MVGWSIPFPFFINQLDAPFQEFDELSYNSDPNSRILEKELPQAGWNNLLVVY